MITGPDLADVLDTDPPGTIASAVVDQVNADGTVNLLYKGGIAVSVEVLSTYTPSGGAVVKVIRQNPQKLLVLGECRTSNVTTVRVTANWSIPRVVQAVPPPVDVPDNPSGLLSPFVVSANESRSFRSGTGWDKTDVYQGSYSGSFGYYRGLWFYGTKPQAAKGVTVTAITINVRRKTGVGVEYSGHPIFVWPHNHVSRPAGAPVLLGSAGGVRAPFQVGNLASPGSSVNLSLPRQWGQALVNGQIKGFAIMRDRTSDYLALDSLSAFSTSGRLSITWT